MFVEKAYAAQIVWPTTTVGSIGELISNILRIVYPLVGIALFGFFVYGGFMWLTSAGDPEKVKKAGNTMLNAAIGVGIIVFALVLTRIVGGVLGVDIWPW